MKKVLTKVTIEIIINKIHEWKKLPMPLRKKERNMAYSEGNQEA